MNDENLIPNSERSPSELKAMTTKGGIASGKARRKKAEFRKLFMQYANMRPTDKEAKQLVAMGFDVEELTNMTSFIVGMFKNGAKGNSKAMEIGVDLMMNYNKRELENQRLREEIEKLKLEQERLRRELNLDSNNFEDLSTLADLLNKKEGEE